MEKIIEYLKQLELSELEAKLYLTLLQTGPITVRDLAANVEVKRTTAYLYVDQLVEKGLVMKIAKGSKKLVAADDPKVLEQLVAEKVKHANEVEKNFQGILREIKTSLPEFKNIEDADIKYSKGKQALQRVYDDALKGKELRVYANLAELEKLFKENDFLLEYQVYEKALEDNDQLTIHEIVADTPGSIENFSLDQTVETKRYFYKYMPADVGLSAPGILMYDNKVAIINAKDNFSIVVLNNSDYYYNSIKLFDFIWKVLPEPED